MAMHLNPPPLNKLRAIMVSIEMADWATQQMHVEILKALPADFKAAGIIPYNRTRMSFGSVSARAKPSPFVG